MSIKKQNQIQLDLQTQNFQMLDYYSNYNSSDRLKFSWSNEAIFLPSQPQLQQLPFLNKLKKLRTLLIALKNQKLRHFQYSQNQLTEQNVIEQKQSTLRHQKAKLSVIDLMNEQSKLQQLTQSIPKQSFDHQKKYQKNIKENQKVQFPQKQKQIQKEIKKSSILDKKNRLASQLNKIGHQLQQTYDQVEQQQIIFRNLCQHYQQNRNISDKNIRLKQKIQKTKQKIKFYQNNIDKNKGTINEIQQHNKDFINWYKKKIQRHIKEVTVFNQQNQKNLEIIKQYRSQQMKNQSLKISRSMQKEQQNEQLLKDKPLEINLRFQILKKQIQRIKKQKQNQPQNKNKDKKDRPSAQEEYFTFNKFYTSQMYNL